MVVDLEGKSELGEEMELKQGFLSPCKWFKKFCSHTFSKPEQISMFAVLEFIFGEGDFSRVVQLMVMEVSTSQVITNTRTV